MLWTPFGRRTLCEALAALPPGFKGIESVKREKNDPLRQNAVQEPAANQLLNSRRSQNSNDA
jgi:hypothetical protein